MLDFKLYTFKKEAERDNSGAWDTEELLFG